MQSVISKVKSFHRNEDGIATVWAIFWMIICFALSGLAIDTANAWKVKQILQSTADVSSLSAGMEFYFVDSDPDHPLKVLVGESPLEKRVKIVANMYAEDNMRPARYGDVLPDESIFLGYWDGNTFTPDIAGDAIFPNAVHVITEQVGNNSLGTFFLRFISIFDFDVRASAVVAFHLAGCEGAAILSVGNVMIEGQNTFGDFCIYGEQGVDVQASNVFGTGTVVGMANFDDCASGNSRHAHCDDESMATSDGLYAALMDGGMLAGDPELHAPDSLYGKTEEAELLFAGVLSSFDEGTLDTGILGLVDNYLFEVSGDTGSNTSNPDTSRYDYFGATDVVYTVNMGIFAEAEEKFVLDVDGNSTDVPAPPISLLEALERQAILEKKEFTGYDTGTTYIVDCADDRLNQTYDYKMDLGSGGEQPTISGIAIIGIDCDYKFDTTIAYESSFIMTTSDSGLKGGRASVSSSNGLTLGTSTPFHLEDPDGNGPIKKDDPWCTDDKLTLLTAGSMKFGSKLQGSNFDIVAAGTVNIASGSNSDPEPHVGSSITAVGDVHLASHHTFQGCGLWAMPEDAVGNSKYLISLVQ